MDVPDPAAKDLDPQAVHRHHPGQKLEGTWWGHRKAYFVCSFSKKADGAPPTTRAGLDLRPGPAAIELELVFKPGGRFDGPDNITVSPYGGGVILAEDGDGEQYLVGTTRQDSRSRWPATPSTAASSPA